MVVTLLAISALQGINIVTSQNSIAATDWAAVASSSRAWNATAMNSAGTVQAVAGSEMNYTDGLVWVKNGATGTWVESLKVIGKNGFQGIAMSTSGATIVASGQPGVYVSRDYGANWTQIFSTLNVFGLAAINADGTQITVAPWYGTGYVPSIFTFDGVSTWTRTSLPASCSSSVDKSGVVTNGTYPISSGQLWLGVGSNAAGNQLQATMNTNTIYMYSKVSSTWSCAIHPIVDGGSISFRHVVSSGTGQDLLAVNVYGSIYISHDYGSTWAKPTQTVFTGGLTNLAVATMTQDGTKMYIGLQSGRAFGSTDSGETWTQIGTPTNLNWYGLSTSDSGQILLGALNGGFIYNYSAPIAQSITAASSSSSLTYRSTATLSSSGSSGTGTISYSVTVGTCTILGTTITATGSSGNCSVTATIAADSRYAAATSASITIGLSKAPLTVTASSHSITYGSTVPTISASYVGLLNSETSSVVTGQSCTTTYTNTSGFGTTPTTSCSGGVATNYAISYVAGSITINKAIPTITVSASGTARYGSLDTLTVTTSVAGAVSVSKAVGGALTDCTSLVTVGNSAKCVWAPNSIGNTTLNVAFSPTDTTNYVDSTTSFIRNVSTALITITPTAGQTKIYGANSPTLTYSVTTGSLVGSDTLNGALTYTGTNVGSYPITIGTLANSNYTITLASVNFGITQATQTTVSLSSLSTAYNPSNKTVALTGSGGSGTGTYSTALDSSNTTAGCAVSGTTLTYTTAGTCVIAVTKASDTNNLARTDVVSFSIGLASQTITFNALTAKSYSSDTFTVSSTSTSTLDVVFTSGSPTVCTTSGTNGSVVTLLGVGTCVVNANQAGDANTSSASQVSQNFTVNPRPLTLTADSKTKVYGTTDPALTYRISSGSLVLGDALFGSLTRVAGTDVGSYQIQQGTVTTANNPKYALTFISDSFTVTRATPTLVVTYPSSNTAIVRPGLIDTPTVTTSSSAGLLTFGTESSSSICSVERSTGVLSLFGAGSCVVVMTSAETTNFLQMSETATVTLALLSTSLTGISSSKIVSMGQPFYAHASIDQSYSFSSGSNGASVSIPAGALDSAVPISISLLTDSTDQRAAISTAGTSVLSVVVSWVAADGSVPSTNAGKAISVTLSNPAIKSGAKIYSVVGTQSQLLGTATLDGSVTTLIIDDPVLVVINPVASTPAPSSSGNGGGGGSTYVAPVTDNSAALKAAQERAAIDLKIAQEKAALELQIARDKAAAELKAAQDAADAEAALRAETDAKIAAAFKAEADAKIAASLAEQKIIPEVTLYSLSPKFTLTSFDKAYLKQYIASLKSNATVTCIGYIYSKNSKSVAARSLARKQASAVCTVIKKLRTTLATTIRIEPVSKAPKATAGAKWVAVSYRVDGFQPISSK